jgi:hypothetical protein
MKSLFLYILICITIFSSCSEKEGIDPRDYIVDISTWEWRHIGYGVIRDNITLMTAWHVYRECQYISCRYRWKDGETIEMLWSTESEKWKDLTYIGITHRDMLSPTISEWERSQAIYTLISRSGSWQRREGHIISLSGSYIWYDGSLSWSLFAGAIETDIVLEKWESGTPVWTLSWDLIGVMSASDERGKRGWVVR